MRIVANLAGLALRVLIGGFMLALAADSIAVGLGHLAAPTPGLWIGCSILWLIVEWWQK